MDAEAIAAGLGERYRYFLLSAAPCKAGELWTPVSIRVGSHKLTDGGVVNELGQQVRAILLRDQGDK